MSSSPILERPHRSCTRAARSLHLDILHLDILHLDLLALLPLHLPNAIVGRRAGGIDALLLSSGSSRKEQCQDKGRKDQDYQGSLVYALPPPSFCYNGGILHASTGFSYKEQRRGGCRNKDHAALVSAAQNTIRGDL